tara:strand:+ start:941 stop:1750 length:810 start_codon:yes stop_codon:yes gene_type:complete
MLASIDRFWYTPLKVRYPIAIFHEDYNSSDRRRAKEQIAAPVAFHRVDFSPNALPSFYNISRIRSDVAASHRNGDLTQPSRRGTYHGFGYRMMCRFYAGQIFNTAALRRADYMLRLDAGDARLTGVFPYDPIRLMRRRRLMYAYLSIAQSYRSSRLDRALAAYRREYNPNIDHTLGRQFFDASGSYNGRYYYNNFEIVALAAFRGKQHERLFDAVERSGAFMTGDTPKQSLGDADFRSAVMPYMLTADKVMRMRLPYVHPVDWDASYAA